MCDGMHRAEDNHGRGNEGGRPRKRPKQTPTPKQPKKKKREGKNKDPGGWDRMSCVGSLLKRVRPRQNPGSRTRSDVSPPSFTDRRNGDFLFIHAIGQSSEEQSQVPRQPTTPRSQFHQQPFCSKAHRSKGGGV